jgi:capsular exopolysaccharide synthesis family protein
MDRIQKALDKAKAKARQKQTMVKPSPRSSTSTHVEVPEVSDFHDIEYTYTKVIEASPRDLEERRVIAGLYNHTQSGVFRMLRTQILKKMRSNQWGSIAITSPTAGEGKSLVAANLAVAIAMELNQTVLLVDMDLRNPSVAKYFNLDVDKGLKDYLEQDIELKDVLINPGIKRLVVLPGKDRAEDSAELLSAPKMTKLVEDIKAQYDSRIIIFDVPPILQTDDVVLASAYFDCSLLVIEDGKNNKANLKKAMQLLEGSQLIGTVVNKSHRPPTHQNY